ncbi:hybrid sensor histidine kinase/response regulator [Aliivibrio finisterrensis]|uniref:histidine kinase n=2 Tax=Vibrionaceae TaxID=641 RepID=A0A4Q5KSH3_9GAMM|nr:hybrid sensor histidine kinase/response regulator [Aliivibrio finisterrensis]RYU55610.1 hybrid sensor histidine kinase/response regulator [Aliivibrio finisterrensis]RYU60293.1 hybrid sensor histidine kinase/response regulator [Aliivibrio finisterrensis]RYU63357.1 hybrid sensor histidine kinase/response regulator [Aliivibrio finisterrensis]RYU82057.1 hybrid sensor histidine kinase/response regulator [Aliivibrio finisterrensis]
MLISPPKDNLLLFIAVFVLLWVAFFIRSLFKDRMEVDPKIYHPYIAYSIFIVIWILTNYYFQSNLLLRFSEQTSVNIAIIANLSSYFAFGFAFLFSCRLSSEDKKLKVWQIILFFIETTFALIINLIPNLTITGITVVDKGIFTIHFGPFATLFFLNAFVFIGIIIYNFTKLRKSKLKLNKEKSIYLLFGILVFMSSTIISQIIIPIIWQDFSFAWVPPALSVTEAVLIGYTLLYHRLYSFRYISFWLSSYVMNLVIFLVPFLYFHNTNSGADFPISIIFIIFTGIFWNKTLLKSKGIASLMIYKDKKTPVDKIYELADEFKYSSQHAITKLALLLDTPRDDLLLVGKNTNYNIFIPHLEQSNSALVKDELDYQIHYAPDSKHSELHQVQKEMDSHKTALILPIFGKNKLISHLLVSAKKRNGSTFSNEEISALQWVLTKVQGYIESERKVRQSQALANSIAHEMRNPLSQLMYHFERIGIQSDKNGISKELEQGKLAIQRGSQLIDIILNESKGVDINQSLFKTYSISVLTEQFIYEYSFESEDIKKRIHLDLNDDFLINVNDTLFGFIVFNLLRNAIHYFEDPNCSISIQLVKGNTTNSLIFRDTGPGINSNILPNIFDDFFTHNKQGGTGLGLSYCLRVMHSFKGNIACYSKQGEFTEFVLSFPKINTDHQAITIEPTAIQQESFGIAKIRNNSSKKTVLIVDDKKVQRMLIQTFIANDNLVIVQAENGAEALKIVNERHIDLIFMDSRMPVMNGAEAAAQIKAGHPLLPIVALTGESGHEEILKITAVMDAYLTKPISKPQLLQMLEKWI